MITKEQAVHLFAQRFVHTRVCPIRHLRMEEISRDRIDFFSVQEHDLGMFDLGEHAWKVTFEWWVGHLDGHYSWCPHTCYIVEPHPGPYLLG